MRATSQGKTQYSLAWRAQHRPVLRGSSIDELQRKLNRSRAADLIQRIETAVRATRAETARKGCNCVHPVFHCKLAGGWEARDPMSERCDEVIKRRGGQRSIDPSIPLR